MKCLKVLRLMHTMVESGYYGVKYNTKELLPPLLGLLDGRNDLPYNTGKACPWGYGKMFIDLRA